LFRVENPGAEAGDFKDYLNPNSLEIIQNAFAEPSIMEATVDDRYQFLRKGYFCLDKESPAETPVFNRTVSLKDTWTKEVKKST
jgi:glutaminyl-tRNA synthetase